MTYTHLFLMIVTLICLRAIQEPVGEEIEQPVVHKPKQQRVA